MTSVGLRWIFVIVALMSAFLGGARSVVNASEDCSNGTVVDNPKRHPALVRDCRILLSIKSTLDEQGILDSWRTNLPLWRWEGVDLTEQQPRRVGAVFLKARDLQGTLPPDIGQLDGLRSLNLDTNRLRGPIPAEWGSLINLETLILSNTGINGRIPEELAGLINLSRLEVHRTQLTGCIPAGLLGVEGQFGSLEFCGGSCERSRAVREGNLERGLVEDCNMLLALKQPFGGTGVLNWSVDVPIGIWDGITTDSYKGKKRVIGLELDKIDLNGILPYKLGNLDALETLKIEDSGIVGEFLDDLDRLSRLKVLNLSGNQIEGRIPRQIGRLPGLIELNLDSNRLTGSIPDELGSLSTLRILDLEDNGLRGDIPPELGELGDLVLLNLSGNRISGGIPSELSDLASLQVLDLSGSGLAGEIPDSVTRMRSLRTLNLNNNQLTGSIPLNLFMLPRLEHLRLDNNALSGGIGSRFAMNSPFETLNLSHNALNGGIPPELGSLSFLEVLNLSSNGLSGEIPSELALLSNLEVIDLGDNQLSGLFPTSLGGIETLAYLNVQGNELLGCLPDEFLAREVAGSFGGLPFCTPPAFSDNTASFSVRESYLVGRSFGERLLEVVNDKFEFSVRGDRTIPFGVRSNGHLYVAEALDYEEQTSFAFAVDVIDGYGGADSIDVVVLVEDVDEPPEAPDALALAATRRAELQVVWAEPRSTGPRITDYDIEFREEGVEEWTPFPFEGARTAVKIGGLKRHTRYYVHVRAWNEEGAGPWSIDGSEVAAPNAAPRFRKDTYEREVTAHPEEGQVVGDRITARDDERDPIRYTLSGEHSELFSIDEESGQLVTAIGLSESTHEAYRFVVHAHDNYDGMGNASVAVTVVPNSPPTLRSEEYQLRIDEDDPPGSKVGRPVTARDDDNQTLLYKLVGESADLFEIDESGQITIRVEMDYELTSSFDLVVEVTDGADTAAASLVVTVRDVREPPQVPLAPVLSSDSPGQISVEWEPTYTTGPPVERYEIRYRAQLGRRSWKRFDWAGGNALRVAVTDMDEGVDYDVGIRAGNDEGWGDWSLSASVGVKASPPQPSTPAPTASETESARTPAADQATPPAQSTPVVRPTPSGDNLNQPPVTPESVARVITSRPAEPQRQASIVQQPNDLTNVPAAAEPTGAPIEPPEPSSSGADGPSSPSVGPGRTFRIVALALAGVTLAVGGVVFLVMRKRSNSSKVEW